MGELSSSFMGHSGSVSIFAIQRGNVASLHAVHLKSLGLDI